jgi:hypothetical protein
VNLYHYPPIQVVRQKVHSRDRNLHKKDLLNEESLSGSNSTSSEVSSEDKILSNVDVKLKKSE